GAAPRLWPALTLHVPGLMVVLPLNVLDPERVSVPVPVLVNDSVPAVFWIVPEKVPEALLSPTVNVGLVELAVLSTRLLPAPLLDRPLTVSLNPPKSKVAVPLAGLITRSPLPAPSG